MEAQIRVPEVSAFDTDVLLLIVPDSAHTACTTIILETLHIDMVINLATKTELENLNKQWNRCLIATKLAMKKAQLVNNRASTLNFQKKNIFLKGSILKIKGFWPENKVFFREIKRFYLWQKRFFTACNSNKNSNK